MGRKTFGKNGNLERNILIAADDWAREIMIREDKVLTCTEQRLFDAILLYRRFTKNLTRIPKTLPKPPDIPRDLTKNFPFVLDKVSNSDIEGPKTPRYSRIPTKPSPPQDHLVLDSNDENEAIEDIDAEWEDIKRIVEQYNKNE